MRNLTIAIAFSATLLAATKPAAAFQATFDFRYSGVGEAVYEPGDTFTGTSGATLQVTGYEANGNVGLYYTDLEGSGPMRDNTTDGLRAVYENGNVSRPTAVFDFAERVKLLSVTVLPRTEEGAIRLIPDNGGFTIGFDRGGEPFPVTRTLDFSSSDVYFNSLGVQSRGGAWSLVSLTVDYPDTGTPVPEPLTILGSGIALGFGAYTKRKMNSKKS